jgi:predicted metal-dependent enzyme (double-stranded beta helix superfamily)
MGVSVSEALQQLVMSVTEILGHDDPRSDRGAPGSIAVPVAELRDRLAAALQQPGLVPGGLREPVLPSTGVGTYLLHDGDGFVVFATVTAPGAVMPAHEHGSWGMVGLYQGHEEEICYMPVESDSADAAVGLVETRRWVYGPGEVAIIDPPRWDIHHVINRDRVNSIAVHLFARDLVREGFRLYAPTYGPTKLGPQDYQPLPAGDPAPT